MKKYNLYEQILFKEISNNEIIKAINKNPYLIQAYFKNNKTIMFPLIKYNNEEILFYIFTKEIFFELLDEEFINELNKTIIKFEQSHLLEYTKKFICQKNKKYFLDNCIT